jgi:hypothetical protein
MTENLLISSATMEKKHAHNTASCRGFYILFKIRYYRLKAYRYNTTILHEQVDQVVRFDLS